MMEWLPAYLALGVFVGFFSGLLGIGGGAIMVPALASLFIWQGFPDQQVMYFALATSMLSIVATSASSLNAHRKSGMIHWRIVGYLSVGVVTGAFVTSTFVPSFDTRFLSLLFAGYIFLVSMKLFFNFQPVQAVNSKTGGADSIAGCFIGVVSALVSIGGGTLTVPYLLWKKYPIKQAIACSAALGLPISLAASVGYIMFAPGVEVRVPHAYGYIYWPAVVCISVMSIFIAPLGAKVAHRLPVSLLKKIFSIFLLLLSGKMVYLIFST